jgi:hypothetical protein
MTAKEGWYPYGLDATEKVQFNLYQMQSTHGSLDIGEATVTSITAKMKMNSENKRLQLIKWYLKHPK